ncbi:hypothetical protein K492DRAFT_209305 [Lichtheimia hyalospora FSU 10163]|nr:hypothetical protein K492DRAFT_209305 [Lichtheimia hyalospora FSU 10163]
MTFDILYCLPQEILGAIFERLTFRERIRCMSLSQQWRTWLQSSPHLLWQDISDMHCDLILNLAPYSAFFEAHHVKRVYLTEHSNIERQMAAASFFAKSGCSSIKTLDIPCHDNNMVSDVKSLINLSGNALIHLTMRCIIEECFVSMVMATCPKLHTFRYHHRFTSRNSYSQSFIHLQLHTQPQLHTMHHHLVEFVLDAIIYLSDAATLVTLMPNLERIRLHICNARREGDGVVFDDVGLILDVMDTYCPRMTNIQLGGTGSRSTFTSFAKIHHDDSGSSNGLCELSIETAEGLHDKHIVPLILKHHHTLQVLHTRSSYISSSSTISSRNDTSPPQSIMQCLASVSYPRLRDLRMNFMWDSYNSYDQNQDLVRMILNAQQLESIHLCVSQQSSSLINDAMFDTLIQLGQLHSLNLQGGNHCELLSPDSIIHWVRNGHYACMQQLHLPGLSQAINNQVLDAITDHMAQHLIVLDIEHASLITDHALRRFTDKIVATADITHKPAALTWLNVTECTGISKETVHYARECLGSHVNIFA